jgi:hypothetical protein
MFDNNRLPNATDLIVAKAQLLPIDAVAGAAGGGGVGATVLHLRVFRRLGTEVLETGAAGRHVTAFQSGTPENKGKKIKNFTKEKRKEKKLK